MEIVTKTKINCYQATFDVSTDSGSDDRLHVLQLLTEKVIDHFIESVEESLKKISIETGEEYNCKLKWINYHYNIKDNTRIPFEKVGVFTEEIEIIQFVMEDLGSSNNQQYYVIFYLDMGHEEFDVSHQELIGIAPEVLLENAYVSHYKPGQWMPSYCGGDAEPFLIRDVALNFAERYSGTHQ